MEIEQAADPRLLCAETPHHGNDVVLRAFGIDHAQPDHRFCPARLCNQRCQPVRRYTVQTDIVSSDAHERSARSQKQRAYIVTARQHAPKHFRAMCAVQVCELAG